MDAEASRTTANMCPHRVPFPTIMENGWASNCFSSNFYSQGRAPNSYLRLVTFPRVRIIAISKRNTDHGFKITSFDFNFPPTLFPDQNDKTVWCLRNIWTLILWWGEIKICAKKTITIHGIFAWKIKILIFFLIILWQKTNFYLFKNPILARFSQSN